MASTLRHGRQPHLETQRLAWCSPGPRGRGEGEPESRRGREARARDREKLGGIRAADMPTRPSQQPHKGGLALRTSQRGQPRPEPRAGTLAHLRGSLCSHHPWQSRTLGTDHLLSSPHSVTLAKNSESPLPVSCGQPPPPREAVKVWDTGKLPAVCVLYVGPLPDRSTDAFPGPHVPGSSPGAHTRAPVDTSTPRPLVLFYEPAFQRMAFSPAPGVTLDLRG